jgi:dipeptidyl aminopeptidase/acylaminoacyl peptidase
MKKLFLFALLAMISFSSFAQGDEAVEKKIDRVQSSIYDQEHDFSLLEKKIDDLLWYEKVGDIAFVDKVFIYGPAKQKVSNPNEVGAKNPLKFWSYVFIPKDLNPNKKYPLMVLPHSGVHADFSTYYAHIVRELIAQGYVVVSAEYRGSTGYGKATYMNIDYGGLENEDVFASKKYMVENYDFIDNNRVGIMGWSHGGMITLMNLMLHPGEYKCGFAGVPVSDVVMRMGFSTDSYRKIFSDKRHIGATPRENIEEYKRRSPVWNVETLKDPLLVYTNTNDDDVFVIEVEHLIRALKAEDKKFEYKIFQDAPGGHSFDRMDTRGANEIRMDIYKFMGRYLKPDKPFQSVKDLRKAAYKF